MTESNESGELSAEQQDTTNLLERLLGRAISDRYVDFCRLASGAFKLRVARPLAAHALRELDGILTRSLIASLEIRPIEESIDPQHIKAREELSRLGFDDAAINKAVDALKPRTSKANQIRQITARLGLAPDGDVAKAWISLSKTAGRAHEHSFHESLSVDEKFWKKSQQPFEMVIRAVALSLQRCYSVLMRRVEELAAMSDKEQAADLFRAEVPGAMPLQWHFFQRLQTPDWLPLLVKLKLIGPPLPGLTGTGINAGRYGEWPAGSYLRRMAESEDSTVRGLVAMAVRNVASSKHPDVRRSGMDIIAAFPAAEAACLAEVAVGWLDRDANFITLHPAAQLVKRLSNGGERAAALAVAARLLQVFDDDGNITSLYEQHMYEHSLQQLAPMLTTAFGLGALELLSDLLNQAVASRKAGHNPEFDPTSYDQGAITDDSNANYSVYDALKCQVRLSAEQVIHDDTLQMSAVLDVLGKHTPKFFRRLEMFLLSHHPAAASERARSLLLDAELLEASWCTHEYSRLALAWFPSLTLSDQQTVLRQADAISGRYMDDWKARVEERKKRPPNAEEVRAFSAHVLRDARWYWRAALPADRQGVVDAIVAEFGDPEAWRKVYCTGQEDSPLATADFAGHSIAEIVVILRTWQPSEEPRRQTITALAQKLMSAAAQKPVEYAQEAMQFADLPVVYVHRLLDGLTDATRNQRDFPWTSVLQLLGLTFTRLNEPISSASIAEGEDPKWHWACAAGCELLKAGLRRGAAGIGFEHKAEVQNLLLMLQRHAPQAPEFEDFEERFERDPYFASETTLRGSAVELCILLIFWLSKEAGSTHANTPRETLARTPTVMAALETELGDCSPNGRIPRSILGRYLNWLFYFGESWLTENIASLFVRSNEQLRRAAWLSHLLHDSGPLGPKLDDLRIDYVNEIGLEADTANDRKEYRQNRLGDYLVALYLNEYLDLQSGGLLDSFLTRAPGKVRQHIMWSLGTNLQKPTTDFPELQRTRALAFWDSRLAAGEVATVRAEFKEELGSIGQWCENHQIEPSWLFDRLLRMFRSGFVPAPADNVVEWLGNVRETHVDRAVEVLEQLLTSPNGDRWVTVGQNQSIRALLTAGQSRGTTATVKRVVELVSFLASSGQPEYLDLVRPAQSCS
ncbi:hypothetical protein V3C40_27705 [Janthinobacterium sp. LS2A]|uniref:hypothetical protein n=1 Tax=Janthinobacterium sp. LS2A TaxID=3118590 RepID=UPI002F95C65E